MADQNHEALATELLPLTSATLTIRIIKSFTYRTSKNLVLKNVDLTTTTVGQLKDQCKEAIKSQVAFKLYRTHQFDTLKKYTVAHGHKTQNLIINLDQDEWILSDESQTLADAGCVLTAENETELSLFNLEEYRAFQANPEMKWQ